MNQLGLPEASTHGISKETDTQESGDTYPLSAAEPGNNVEKASLGYASERHSIGAPVNQAHTSQTSELSEEDEQQNLVERIPGMSLLEMEHDESLKMEDPVSDKPTSVSDDLSTQLSSDNAYVDPTPNTPRYSPSPARMSSDVTSPKHINADGKVANYSKTPPEECPEEESTSEIQSIMDQFDEEHGGPSEEEVMSPRMDFAGPMLGSPVQHPPRKSSLEPLRRGSRGEMAGYSQSDDSPPLLQKLGPQNETEALPVGSQNVSSTERHNNILHDGVSSPQTSAPTLRPQLPEPDPEPDLPFDFHRFLEQLRHRTADPVAKFLRSFLIEFGKKQWMVHEQVKIISDFLAFITNKMAQCDVWRGVSDAEFDNAKEGMEKLVMNRLYSQTFSPAIPPPPLPPTGKGKRKIVERLLGPGRKGQHQEDIERDDVLGQKVRIYRWVQEEHLDVPPIGDSGKRFMTLAQQEILKIKNYRAPRDKVICVLNCCKVIFGFLRSSKLADTSADSFVPLLIYVVLRANPEHLVSNVQYILRFRNQDKLGGEAGYYLSSLMGAIQFIESLDRTSLTISDNEFEKKVEASVSEIAEGHDQDAPAPAPAPPPTHPAHISEKSGLSEPEMIPRNSMEAEYNTPRRPLSSRGFVDRSTGIDRADEGSPVSGLLRTIQRPLSSLGRMFSEDTPTLQNASSKNQPPPPPARLSPAVFQPPRHSSEDLRPQEVQGPNQVTRTKAEEAAARQASAEAAEAQRTERIEHQNVLE